MFGKKRKQFGARVLKFEEAISWGREVVWIQLRSDTCAIPVHYYLEHSPFLRFCNEELGLMFKVKKDWYGKTWRCFDVNPEDEDRFPWEEAS
jgi:hypothetical protein